jgi:large subunit ribosomal protein L23
MNKKEGKSEKKEIKREGKIGLMKKVITKKEKPEKEAKERKKSEVKEFDPWSVLIYPHLTEKSMNMVELENKLVFIVNLKADKEMIKKAVEKEFNVKVDWVRTEISRKGYKKAYIKINPEYSASDIASKLGML